MATVSLRGAAPFNPFLTVGDTVVEVDFGKLGVDTPFTPGASGGQYLKPHGLTDIDWTKPVSIFGHLYFPGFGYTRFVPFSDFDPAFEQASTLADASNAVLKVTANSDSLIQPFYFRSWIVYSKT